nr:glycosyltransferase [Metabacillus mangrovi]
MDNQKVIHVIVATAEWNKDGLRYRRHRLAEFLKQQPDTQDVYWVHPSESPSSEEKELANGIIQYPVKDLLKHRLFRFGRYYDIFYKRKLTALTEVLEGQENIRKILWFTFPGFPGLAHMLKWDNVVYDCSDMWTISMTGKKNLVMKMREKSILQAENQVIANADPIFCTSDYLNANVKKNPYANEKKVTTFENGVEFALFQNHQAELPDVLKSMQGPVLGFIGGIKPKLDFPMLQLVMKQRPDWTLLFVGPDGTNQDPAFQELLKLPNVIWTGKVKPEEVPVYMSKIDAGIMPYKPSLYNQAVFPLKMFEFLAAGVPSVGANLPSTEKFAQKGIYEYQTGRDHEEFISHCEELLNSESPELRAQRVELARSQDWSIIFNKMLHKVMN